MPLDERNFPDETLDELFTYHAPKDGDPERYVAIREAGKILAQAIRDHAPASSDRTDAIRKVRESVMAANAAIALEEARG